ncbi:MAG: bifunctional (p)ppGpp synthetase/guanosine-3',5'-bis(diphosphate) 3'-pyrophosphohydrolase [Bacteroidota bacterium]
MQNTDIEIEKKEILKSYSSLLRACRPNIDKKDKQLIRKAFEIAAEAHKDMRRKSGEPYIYHPLEVAHIVASEIGLGTTSIVCSLLHDVVEDTDYTLEDIKNLFGEKVARIIDGLTKMTGVTDQSISLQAENFRKMLLTLSDDVRVILIKLADRLHNMRTLDSMPREKQLKIASETLYLYAPLAHRLGLYALKTELEDLGLKYTEPEIFNIISGKIQETQDERNKYVNRFVLPLKKNLIQHGLNFSIFGRVKSIYSIWDKMKRKEIPFEEVYDLFAIRIIIDSPFDQEKSDCWKVYSIITDSYRPKPDRLRDWVSTPKANGYEALHTTVMGPEGKWVEVQIRTKRMDEVAEKGYASHWKYKESVHGETALDEWLRRIKELLESSEMNALDFLDDFKLNLFSEEIFVFTPKGEFRSIPAGSSALDFAYSIHSKIGDASIGAKVNHKLVPLNCILKSGDQIEIITSSKQKPKEEWLSFATTAKAKTQIKQALKEEKKAQVEIGKKQLDKKLTYLKVEITQGTLNKLTRHFGLPNLFELYYKVAKGEITIRHLKEFSQENERGRWYKYLRRSIVKSKITQEITSPIEKLFTKFSGKPQQTIGSDDLENIQYTIAACCNPIPGDDVFGFITDKDKVTVHRTNCEQAIQMMSKFGNKIVKAKWTSKETLSFMTGIKVTGIDQVGMLNQITKIISSEHNINIRSLNIESNEGTFVGMMTVFVNDTNILNDLILNLKKVKGVISVTRL